MTIALEISTQLVPTVGRLSRRLGILLKQGSIMLGMVTGTHSRLNQTVKENKMAKMASLHAEGITNLHDYDEGRKAERELILSIIRTAVYKNEDLDKLPVRMVLGILAAVISTED
jgi:hypothetical protein